MGSMRSSVKISSSLLLILFIITLCEGALILKPAIVKSEFPKSCWMDKLNEAIHAGGSWQEPGCIRSSCVLYRNQPYVQLETCGAVNVPEGCTSIRNWSLEYPHCCPSVHCPDDVSLEAFLGPEYTEFNNWLDTYYDESSRNEP